MRRATLTILGLYQWDQTLFDDFNIPEQLDKDALIDSIILECADLEITLPNYDIFKRMISSWSAARSNAWEHMYNALTEEYNALHNYDRTETHDDDWSNTRYSSMNQSSGGQDVLTNRTAAFNGDTLATAGSDTTAYGGTANTVDNGTESGNRDYTIRAYGNIGVTTSQQMLESEISLRSKYDMYGIITTEFKKKFCIMIY